MEWIKDLGTDQLGEVFERIFISKYMQIYFFAFLQDRMSIEVFKKDRDKWVPTIYNINRADVCQALFNPTEIWHQYLKDVTEENRKCPFFVGVSTGNKQLHSYTVNRILFNFSKHLYSI